MVIDSYNPHIHKQIRTKNLDKVVDDILVNLIYFFIYLLVYQTCRRPNLIYILAINLEELSRTLQIP